MKPAPSPVEPPPSEGRFWEPLGALSAAELEEVERTNVGRVRVALALAFTLHLFGVWTGATRLGPGAAEATRLWLRNLFWLQSAMLPAALLGLLALARPWGLAPARWFRRRAALVVAGAYLLWAPLVSGNAQLARPNIEVFSFVHVAIAALLLVPSRPLLVLQAGSLAVMLAAIARAGHSPALLRSLTANVLTVVLGSAALARVLFAAFLRQHRAQRTITEQRAALLALNAELEQRVQRKVTEALASAAEVRALSERLSAQVRDRSRELSLALARAATTKGSSAPLGPGSVLAERLRIVRALGEGGMGAVYLAEELPSGQQVAVKVVLGAAAFDSGALQRFLRESRAAASVAHPAVARTLAVDLSAEGLLYQVQELVEGEPLARVLEQHPRLDAGSAARLGATLASALAAAHAAGVVHRDLKPSNVMLTRAAPGLKLLDFGIARLQGDAGEAALTGTRDLLGTPAYMAPEQLTRPELVDGRTDVYALGLLLYRLLTGVLPHASGQLGELLAARVILDPEPLEELAPEVPSELAALLRACLSRALDARPRSSELTAALSAVAEREGAPALEVLCARWLDALPATRAPSNTAVNEAETVGTPAARPLAAS